MSKSRKENNGTKRTRVNYTPGQLAEMEGIFQRCQYPDPLILDSLSARANIPLYKLCTWFQNKRSKFRKDSKKGHIEWMRGQLFEPTKITSNGHSPGGSTSSLHVLSTPEAGTAEDIHKPSVNVHHMPTWTKDLSPPPTPVDHTSIPSYSPYSTPMTYLYPQPLESSPVTPTDQSKSSYYVYGSGYPLDHSQSPPSCQYTPPGSAMTSPGGTTTPPGGAMTPPGGAISSTDTYPLSDGNPMSPFTHCDPNHGYTYQMLNQVPKWKEQFQHDMYIQQ